MVLLLPSSRKHHNSLMSNLDFIETCVVGAGVVGLAIARQLSTDGHQVMVLESGAKFGEGVSSRNSEVIHAGIYYAEDSLKARLCVRGKSLLYEYCASRGIAHRAIGKLIVATSVAEEPELEQIERKAKANGVCDLRYLSARHLKAIEPNVYATMALMSPSTGIVDSHGLMTAFLADLEAQGGGLACHAHVKQIRRMPNGFTILTLIEGEPYALNCKHIVNAAGLGAQKVAAGIEGFEKSLIPALYLCRGNYFLLQGENPFHHLIYPVPDSTGAGLGIHATIDIGGQVKFGPDVEYIDTENYDLPEKKLLSHYQAIRRYLPQLRDGRLIPGYSGIRPKLQGPGDEPADFIIQSQDTHQISGLINLFGIESPGLTSCLAIAETVSGALK
jgi:L-2-hydroxyglutarate oxidase LhgO